MAAAEAPGAPPGPDGRPGASGRAAQRPTDAAAADPARRAVAQLLDAAARGAEGAPQVYERANTDARVILRAREPAWIQVSSPAGDYTFTRTLEPGEALLVPNRSDLELWTGNAGGLEIIVDGTPVPALAGGARGAAQRLARPRPPGRSLGAGALSRRSSDRRSGTFRRAGRRAQIPYDAHAIQRGTAMVALSEITRHRSHAVRVGPVTLGGGAPIVVQSMTNTDTADVDATVRQVMELAEAGSEIVRITVNTDDAAKAVPHIRDRLRVRGCEVPLVGDFHYHGHLFLTRYPECAEALAKLRINPGNVGFGKKRDSQFEMMIEAALRHDKPVRIGVNWGSLDQDLSTRMMDENARLAEPKSADEVLREALVVSALASARRAEELGLGADRIVISAKVSRVPDLVAVYRELAGRSSYALHLGLTEAGIGAKGIVATTAALAILLQEGIGDTIRASLTPRPGEARTQEVIVCQELLQSLGPASVRAAGGGVPRLRAHHQHLLPGPCRQDPGLPARADADLEAALSRASRA